MRDYNTARRDYDTGRRDYNTDYSMVGRHFKTTRNDLTIARNYYNTPDILNVSSITTSGCVKKKFDWRKFGAPNIRCFVINFLLSHFYTLFV